MDIQTKKWRVQDHATMPSHVAITNRHHVNTVDCVVKRSCFPSDSVLAAISESQFDRLVQSVIKSED